MKQITGGAAVAVLLTLVGCADDTGEAETSASTQAAVTTVSPTIEKSMEAEPDADEDGDEPDSDESISAYIEGVASASPSVASEAFEYAAPDSAAYVYLQHRVNLFKATDFLVDETHPGPRLAIGDGSVVESNDVTAEFLSAYRSITGDILFIIVQVETREESAELNIYSATYRGPDGEQRQAAEAMGPFEIGAESTASIALSFPEAEPGGTVTLDGYVGDDYSDAVEFTMQAG